MIQFMKKSLVADSDEMIDNITIKKKNGSRGNPFRKETAYGRMIDTKMNIIKISSP